jgi:hypothetical protein
VLLLLPSLIFTLSILAGPFLLKPRLGGKVGVVAFVPRVLGWLTSFGIYIALSALVAEERPAPLGRTGPSFAWSFALLLYSALRYVLYRPRLRRRTATLARMLAEAGYDPQRGGRTCAQLVSQAGTEPAKAEPILTRNGIPAPSQPAIIAFLEAKIAPLLRKACG